MNWVSKVFKDTFYYKLAFAIMGLLTTVPYVYQRIEGFIKVFLVWGFVVLLFRIKDNWKYYLKKEYLILAGFCASYVLTILVNYGENTKDEIMLLAYTGIFLFVLTYCDRQKSPVQIRQELFIIFRCIICITFIYAFICAFMFFFALSGEFMLRGNEFPYGMYEGRLWGIYNPNTGGVINYISFFASLMLLCFDKAVLRWRAMRYGLYLNVMLQFICFSLAQSRGAEISMLAFVALYVLFIRRNKTKKESKLRKACLAYCAVAVFAFTADMTLTVVNIVPNTSEMITGTEEKEKEEAVKREEKDSNGRTDMWVLGFNIFKDNPLLGIGSQSITDEMENYFEKEWFEASKGGGLHSLYVTVLASCGIVGTLFFVAFFAIICLKGLAFLMNSRGSVFQKSVMTFIPAFLIGDLVETRILLTTSFFAIFFWLILGYTMYYFDKNDEKMRISDQIED